MAQMRVQSSNIAHDLRTPRTRPRGLLETRLCEAATSGTPISASALEDALHHIDRLTGTFDALLRLARIESGAGKDSFDYVDLSVFLEEIAAPNGPVIEDAGHVLALRISDPQTIRGDRGMLTQKIANLIQNALRYGAVGQTIALGLHGRRLTLTDEGPGIPRDERDNVLTPLTQIEATRQEAGFGLGLSLVNAIAKLHDADLTLADGPSGKGRRVTVHFPEETKSLQTS